MKDLVKRREFLKAGSMAAAGMMIGMPSILSAGTYSKNDEIRVGVIGTGNRGTGLIRVMQKVPELRVMACCDVLPFRLEEGMKHADSKAKAYSDYKKLLDNKKLDAVVIATPLSTHSQIAIDTVDAGKHVYSEKTMTYNIEQAFDVLKKARTTDRIFQVGHQYHSSRLYKNVVDIIHEGHIGKVTKFECQYHRNGDWRREVPDPKLERQINWRMYKEYSEGMLAELSSHQIDFVNWVTGTIPTSVIGSGGIDYWKDGRETFDNTHVLFDYPDGVRASFSCTTANAYNSFQIRVLGDKATIVIGFTGASIIPEAKYRKELGLVDGVSSATIPVMDENGAIPIQWDGMDPTLEALEEFADNVLNTRKPSCDVETGTNLSVAVRLAFNSIHERKRMDWKDSYKI